MTNNKKKKDKDGMDCIYEFPLSNKIVRYGLVILILMVVTLLTSCYYIYRINELKTNLSECQRQGDDRDFGDSYYVIIPANCGSSDFKHIDADTVVYRICGIHNTAECECFCMDEGSEV